MLLKPNPKSLLNINKLLNSCINNYGSTKEAYCLYELCKYNTSYLNNYDFFIWNKKKGEESQKTTIKAVEFFPNKLDSEVVINHEEELPLCINHNYDYLLLFPKNFQILTYYSHCPLYENNLIFIPSYYFLINEKIPNRIQVKNININPMYYDLFLKDVILNNN